ncbi:MAG TPA: hypothetical protein VLC10_00025 [Patescibacteria group bacterium]|nr:hypothetical protein [Patescibacteria group bacterium]
MNDKKRTLPRWTPVATGLAVSAVAAAFLLAARFRTDDGAAAAWVVPSFALASGGLAALFHARRDRALLLGVLFGLANGIVASLELLGQPVEDVFFVVASTMAFFMILCLAIGAFVEFVCFLHHVAHGRDPRRYGGPPPKG